MSTYASDWKYDEFVQAAGDLIEGFVDVAADTAGEDVRLILDGAGHYLAPEHAIELAAALVRCAAATMQWRTFWQLLEQGVDEDEALRMAGVDQ